MSFQQRVSAVVSALLAPGDAVAAPATPPRPPAPTQPALQSGGGLAVAAQAERLSTAASRFITGPAARLPHKDDLTGRMTYGEQQMRTVLANPALPSLALLAHTQVRAHRAPERDYGPPVGIILGTNMIADDAKVYGNAPLVLYRDDADAVRLGYVDSFDHEFIQPLRWHHCGDIDFGIVAATLEKLIALGTANGRLPSSLIGYGYELSSRSKISAALSVLSRSA